MGRKFDLICIGFSSLGLGAFELGYNQRVSLGKFKKIEPFRGDRNGKIYALGVSTNLEKFVVL